MYVSTYFATIWILQAKHTSEPVHDTICLRNYYTSLHFEAVTVINTFQYFFQQFSDVLSHLERGRLFEAGIGGSVLWLPARVWHQARPELLHLQLVRGGRLQLPRALLPHQMRRVRHVRETGGREDGRTRRRGGRKRQGDRGRPNVRTKRTEHQY